MPDATDEFLRSPVAFLHRYPFIAMAQSQLGLTVQSVQIRVSDQDDYADLYPTPQGQAGAIFYVLSWDLNFVSVGTLGTNARLFFTGPLTGCMFAVDKNWYTPRVLHVNYQGQHAGMDVNRMTTAVNNQMAQCTSKIKWYLYSDNTPNITVVQSHNRNQNESYNIFGYRTGHGWTFWQQVCDLGMNPRVVALNLDTWF